MGENIPYDSMAVNDEIQDNSTEDWENGDYTFEELEIPGVQDEVSNCPGRHANIVEGIVSKFIFDPNLLF